MNKLQFGLSLVVMMVAFCHSSSARPDHRGLIPPPPGTHCVSPTGQGLGLAIREMLDLFPADEIITIYITAVTTDEEVVSVIEYLSSDEFIKIVTVMQNTKEFLTVLEYFCDELHFDVYFYLNALSWALGLPEIDRPSLTKLTLTNRNGFNGMLKDILNVLPVDKIKETYQKRYEEDEFLRMAMAKLQSEEFRTIGDAIENLQEYQDLLQRLRDIGVDVDSILEAIMAFMGWRPHQP